MADEKLAKMFEEFLLLYKVVNRKSVIEILKTEISNDQSMRIYQLSDGARSTREISSILNNKCSHTTVANLWNKWALSGLVSEGTRKGRFKAAFDLVEYGIAIIETEE